MAIFIVGYMASGKTTFGEALARKLNKEFIDLDLYIEAKHEKSVKEIFTTSGEEGFREIEKEALYEVATKTDAIIACGGGTPCFFDNMDFINKKGVSIMLETSLPVLVSRLLLENAKRPLVSGKSKGEIAETIQTQLSLRMPYYSKAHIKWEGDTLENEQEIESNIKRFIETFPFVFSKSFC